jgi:hypothetical protein
MFPTQRDSAAIAGHFPEQIATALTAGEDGPVRGSRCRCEGVKIFREEMGGDGGQDPVLSKKL